MAQAARAARFLMDPTGFLNDSVVLRMRLAARGAYITLLLSLWDVEEPGVVEADDFILATLARCTPAEWAQVKPQIEPAFDTTSRPGCWVQKRMVREHAAQDRHLQRLKQNRSKAGSKGGFASGVSRRQRAVGQAVVAKPKHLLEANEAVEGLGRVGLGGVGVATDVATEQQTLVASRDVLVEFDDLWRAYPHYGRRSSRAVSLKRWQMLKPRPSFDVVMAGLRASQASPDWKKDNGQFVPALQVWINQRGWDASNGSGPAGESRAARILRRLEVDEAAQASRRREAESEKCR